MLLAWPSAPITPSARSPAWTRRSMRSLCARSSSGSRAAEAASSWSTRRSQTTCWIQTPAVTTSRARRRARRCCGGRGGSRLRSAASSASIDGQRCSGSAASPRASTRARRVGRVRRRSETGLGRTRRARPPRPPRALALDCLEQREAEAVLVAPDVGGCPRQCSGAMYAGVPAKRGACSCTARASPKSVTRTRPSSPTSTFSGLKSPWTMPARCAAASPWPAAV